MPTYNGTPGLAGTIGLTILDSAGSVHVARATAGISEPVALSGAYYVAEHDATATLTYVWDEGVGTIGASETLYVGRGVTPATVGAAMTLHADYDAAKAAASATNLADLHTDVGTAITNIATVDTVVDAILVDTGTTLDAALAALPTDADVNAACDTAISDAALATGASLAALHDFDPATDVVAHVTLVATTTTNTDMRGTDDAALATELALMKKLVYNKQVESSDGTTVTVYDDNGTTVLGYWTRDVGTKTRGAFHLGA